MMRSFRLAAYLLCGVVVLPMAAGATRIRIFTQKVDAATICGTEFGRFECSTTRQHMRLQRSDIELQMQDDQPNYMQVLGKVYTRLTGSGLDLRPCGQVDENVFNASDLASLTSATSFTYKRRSDTRVEAGLQADVRNVLVAAGVTGPILESLQADFRGSYSRAAGRENNMTGSYYRLALKDSVVSALQNPATTNAKAKACAAFLRSQRGAALAYSVAVIRLDSASYASSLATDVAAQFAAKVRAKAPGADIVGIQAGITSAVRTNLSTSLGRSYRVISWDYLTAQDIHSS